LGTILPDTIEELNKLIALSSSIDCKAIVLCPNNDIDDKESPDDNFQRKLLYL